MIFGRKEYAGIYRPLSLLIFIVVLHVFCYTCVKTFSMIFKIFWKPVVWALIIITLSVIPTNEISNHMWTIVPYEDKIMHFIFYGIFSFLLIRSLIIYYKKSQSVWLLALVTFIIIFLFGMTLEIVQAKFTSYRQGDIIDMMANLTGCIFAILIVLIIPCFRVSPGAK